MWKRPGRFRCSGSKPKERAQGHLLSPILHKTIWLPGSPVLSCQAAWAWWRGGGWKLAQEAGRLVGTGMLRDRQGQSL